MGTLSRFAAPADPSLARREGRRRAQQGFSQQEAERLERRSGYGMDPYYAALLQGYLGVGESRQAASLERRRQLGQQDLSMLSPGMLQIVLQQQRERQTNRRRQRRHAVVGGMGFQPSGRKTLLGQ